MKKIVYAVLATISGLVLLFSYRTSLGAEATAVTDAGASPASAGSTASSTTDSSTTDSSATDSGASGTADAGATGTSTTTLADGTYTGAAASTRFGPVQVAITVQGGEITAVDVPQYPASNSRDRQINERALPVLASETISAQSAQIDMVSGATYTSRGYLQSLQSAIDEALQ